MTGGSRLRWALRDGWIIAVRDMQQWVREPQMILWGLLFPIMFVLLFAYLFGSGIIVPGGGNYREFLMAGMFAQTMAFGIGETAMAVHVDAAKGVTDRFRSMPMAPSGVVVGRCIAGMLYSAVSLVILVGTGLAIGWRWHGSPGEALAAFGLLLLLRLAFLWLGILLGLRARTVESVNSLYGLLYPVTMLSSAFIAVELMPGWLGAVASWNPLSATVNATRDLFGNPGVDTSGWVADHSLLMAILWPAIITVVTVPFAVRAFHRLSQRRRQRHARTPHIGIRVRIGRDRHATQAATQFEDSRPGPPLAMPSRRCPPAAPTARGARCASRIPETGVRGRGKPGLLDALIGQVCL